MSVTEMPDLPDIMEGAGNFLPETALLHEYAAGFYTNFLSEERTSRRANRSILPVGFRFRQGEPEKYSESNHSKSGEAMNLMSLLKDRKNAGRRNFGGCNNRASGIAPWCR